jgi:L-ornithine Nalpha-acyltransferase
MKMDVSRYRLALAASEEDVAAAQRLRFRVFVEEMAADASPEERAARREWDAYDAHCDHLLLIDREAIGDPLDRVVGVYRLMPGEVAAGGIGFYGEAEYDLSPLRASGRRLLELGRSCVAREHRGGPAMHLMWNGLAEYVLDCGVEVLFGVASFPGTDPEPVAEALSHLYHAHFAPPDLRVRARPPHRLEMDRMPVESVEAARALQAVPPLIKAYLRLGGFVGDGAFVDRAFNTIDVCLIMDTARMVARYRSFYARGREAGT